MNNGNILKIAVQKKGRLMDDTIALLKKSGLELDGYQERLLVRVRNFDLELLFLREVDIAEYVQDGICDLGILGLNTVEESEARLEVVEKLRFGSCRLCIAAPKKSKIYSVNDLAGMRIATSYSNILGHFLKDKKIAAEIVSLSGSVELAPTLNIADAICDLVSTGSTLSANGLKVVEILLESEAVLVKSQRLFSKEKKALYEQLILRIRASLNAAGKKYVMLNAPGDHLEEITAMMPALKSPTVMPLFEKGLFAVHSVMPEDIVWKKLDDLKRAGASGIIVLPIDAIVE